VKPPSAVLYAVFVVVAQRRKHWLIVAHDLGMRVDDAGRARSVAVVEFDDMIVREMVARPEYGETSVKLRNHRIAAGCIHNAVQRAERAAAGEALTDPLDIARIDGEAIPGNQFANLNSCFEPCNSLCEGGECRVDIVVQGGFHG